MLLRYLFLGLLVGIAPSEALAQRGHVVLHQERVIGDDQTNPTAMLGRPSLVLAGEEEVYVFDSLPMKVKVFDGSGRPSRSLGGRGGGPGEFSHLTTGHLAPSGDLYVLDQLSFRMTRFSADGVETRPMDESLMLWPRQIIPYEGDLLVLYLMEGATYMVHRWDASLTRHIDEFAPVSLFSTPESFMMKSILRYGGKIARWHDWVVLAPPVCTGELHAFDVGTGERVRSFRSDIGDLVPLEEVDLDATPDHSDLVVTYGQDGKRGARVRCWTTGLVSTTDDHLVYFSTRQTPDGKALFADVFDPRGARVGTHRFDEFAVPGDYSPNFVFDVFEGRDDEVFLVDRRGDYPLVRVLSMEVGP